MAGYEYGSNQGGVTYGNTDFDEYGKPKVHNGGVAYGNTGFDESGKEKVHNDYEVNANNNNGSPAGFYSDITDAPPESRRRFILKVYAILFFQLCATAGIGYGIYEPLHSPNNVDFITEYGLYILIGAAVFYLITVIIISCCPEFARPFPANYIILSLFTASAAVLVGVSCAKYEPAVIMMCLGITAGLFLVLSLFAVCVKTDFTGCGIYLVALLFVLIVFSIILGCCQWIFKTDAGAWDGWRIGISIAVLIIFSLFVVYDTQCIVGGENRKYSFSTEDFVFAAIALYLDIVNLFLALLSIFGDS